MGKVTKFYLTHENVQLMTLLVAGLDPDRYVHDSAKALIYQAKEISEALNKDGEVAVVIPRG